MLPASRFTASQTLAEWASNHRPEIDRHTHQFGVLLFRDFEIPDAKTFRDICAAIRPELRSYTGGDSPRTGVCDKVYTSTEYDSGLEVLLHNELSYAGWCPDRVFFGCLQPADAGGETQIADGRAVYQALDPEVRTRFESRGVTYLQHLPDESFGPGPGKSLSLIHI